MTLASAGLQKAIERRAYENQLFLQSGEEKSTKKVMSKSLEISFGKPAKDGSVGVVFKNKGKERKAFSVVILARDKNGRAIASQALSAGTLEPGQEAGFRGFKNLSEVQAKSMQKATFEIQSASEF
jgi:hypothetical protein